VHTAAYPEEIATRRRWIEERRAGRNAVDPLRPHAFFVEEECSDGGEVVRVLTIFLTNRECPWRCLMCDLWKNTLAESVAPGMIPAQIDHAVSLLEERGRPCPQEIKLYNSGSFFDRGAILKEDYPHIARQVKGYSRVIVECHPKLVNDEVLRFRDLIGTQLEIAMGLETVNPDTLAKLNKGMTLEDFADAAGFLRKNDIGVRAFILLKPPFTTEADGIAWAKRSIESAFEAGVGVASIIPTRAGNGALEALTARGEFSPPCLGSLEDVLDYGIGLKRGRVFADLWDLRLFSQCAECFEPRKQRLEQMNQSQRVLPRLVCPACEG
jgi:archaeosine synthase beta-subunit